MARNADRHYRDSQHLFEGKWGEIEDTWGTVDGEYHRLVLRDEEPEMSEYAEMLEDLFSQEKNEDD